MGISIEHSTAYINKVRKEAMGLLPPPRPDTESHEPAFSDEYTPKYEVSLKPDDDFDQYFKSPAFVKDEHEPFKGDEFPSPYKPIIFSVIILVTAVVGFISLMMWRML